MTFFYLTLAFAIFVLAAMMWRYDMHRRERWYMLLLAVLLGAIARPTIGSINDWLITVSGSITVFWLAALAGFGEELIKVAAVLFIAVCFRDHFDDDVVERDPRLILDDVQGIPCVGHALHVDFGRQEEMRNRSE